MGEGFNDDSMSKNAVDTFAWAYYARMLRRKTIHDRFSRSEAKRHGARVQIIHFLLLSFPLLFLNSCVSFFSPIHSTTSSGFDVYSFISFPFLFYFSPFFLPLSQVSQPQLQHLIFNVVRLITSPLHTVRRRQLSSPVKRKSPPNVLKMNFNTTNHHLQSWLHDAFKRRWMAWKWKETKKQLFIINWYNDMKKHKSYYVIIIKTHVITMVSCKVIWTVYRHGYVMLIIQNLCSSQSILKNCLKCLETRQYNSVHYISMIYFYTVITSYADYNHVL